MAITKNRRTACAVGLLLGIVTSCGGVASDRSASDTDALNGSTDGGLPLLEVSAFYETPPLEEILKLGDSGVRAVLKDVLPDHRIVKTEEEPDIPEERVGLQFEIVDTFAGDLKPGDVIVVEGDGYIIDPETKERTAALSIDGHGADDWQVGSEYIFFAAKTEVGLQFRSPELVALIVDGDLLVPIIANSIAPGFEKVRTVGDVERLVESIQD